MKDVQEDKAVGRIYEMARNKCNLHENNPAIFILVGYAALLLKSIPDALETDDIDAAFDQIKTNDSCDQDLKNYILDNPYENTYRLDEDSTYTFDNSTYTLDNNTERFKAAAFALAKNFSEDELRSFVFSHNFLGEILGHEGARHITSDSIIRLALAVLDIQDGDTVADLGCGIGGFLTEAAKSNNSTHLYGIEWHVQSAYAAKATCKLADANAEIEIGDMLERIKPNQFDKVFCDTPLGMRLSGNHGSSEYYEILRSGMDGFGRPRTADWIFAKLVYDSLRDGGKALVIMRMGSTLNGAEKQMREYFVNNNMLEAVIALPPALMLATSAPIVAFVLGDNHGPIRMVDASDLSIPGRRLNSLGHDEINEILLRLSQDGRASKLVDKSVISSAEYSLYPSRYLGREIDLINPACIEDITLSIERGSSYRASTLDAMATVEDTKFSYLMLKDITDGRIGSNLTHLTHLDDETKKQWLHNGDLVISKNGAPFKIAVAEVPDGLTILANGNLYILHLDPDKADPYYVAAFLSSEVGKELLEMEVVGSTIPNLPLGNLKRIRIPLPPLDEQKKVADAYQARLDEIEVLKIKLEKARIAASEAYDEVMGH